MVAKANPEVTQELWEAWQVEQSRKTANLAASKGFDPCSCVSFAKWATGVNPGSFGLAKNYPVNSVYPVVGGLAVFDSGGTGHIGVVIVVGPQIFRIKEYNWKPCSYSERDIPYDQTNLKGFYI